MPPPFPRGRPVPNSPGVLIGPFLHYLLSECQLSAHTLAAYRSDLMKFRAWYESSGLGGVDRLTVKGLVGYVDYLLGRGYASSTVGRHLASLSTFFRYLVVEGKVAENLARLLSAPAVWDRLPDVLGPETVAKLLESPSPETALGARDRAILETLYATGFRASEAVGLRLRDLDLTALTIRCIGKGDKQRVVPLGSRARDALIHYLASARPRLGSRQLEPEAVFLSRRGRALSRLALWRIVKQHAATIGVSAKVSPHTLRHCFATHLLAGGADIRVVQELLGHASIGTTQIYTRVEVSRLIETHQRFHPRGAAARSKRDQGLEDLP